MQTIPIQAIPAQTFTYIDPSNNTWDIGIRNVGSQVAFTFTLNGIVLIQNVCAVAGYRIIPYDYLESGNFVLITRPYQLPDYTQFGISQTFVFLEEADILSFRAPIRSLARVTTGDFDSNGGIPLRFSPQGYTQAVNYEVELPSGYVTETGDVYVDEGGSDTYIAEQNPVYITEDGTGFYFAEVGA